jgi:DNA-binding phage protein
MLKTKKIDMINYLIARARKAMIAAAKAAAVTRTNLYRSFSENGRPVFDTVAKVA